MVNITKDTIIGDILGRRSPDGSYFLSIGMLALAAPLPAVRSWKRPAWFTASTWTSCWHW